MCVSVIVALVLRVRAVVVGSADVTIEGAQDEKNLGKIDSEPPPQATSLSSFVTNSLSQSEQARSQRTSIDTKRLPPPLFFSNSKHSTTTTKRIVKSSTSSSDEMNEPHDQQASNFASLEGEDGAFAGLSRYPFDSDSEYLSGLSAIFGHPSTPPSASEISQNADLVLQAKCFYFARRHGLPPIDPAAYRIWLQSRPSDPADTAAPVLASAQASHLSSTAPQAESDVTAGVSTSLEATAQDPNEPPPYPTSFAAIVDLITRNVPVPGIEEVPDTVLEHGSTKIDDTPRRKKPWEVEAQPAETTLTETAGPVETYGSDSHIGDDTINGYLTSGEGVVKILQPDAIPESNLFSKEK